MKTVAVTETTFLPKTHEPFWSFSVRSLIVLSTAIACGCTLALRLPGLGWVAGALLVVVTIRTLLVFKRQRTKGISTSRWEKSWLFFRSLVRATFAVIFLCAGVVGSFMLAFIALVIATSAGYSDTMSAWLMVIAWALPLLMLAAFLSGVNRRFHQDVSHQV